jgi:hypothetical protein
MNHLVNDEPHPQKLSTGKNQKLSPSLTFFASFLVQSSAITLVSCESARPEVAPKLRDKIVGGSPFERKSLMSKCVPYALDWAFIFLVGSPRFLPLLRGGQR